MYTRQALKTPNSIIQNDKPVFGYFPKPFKKLDICDINQAYGSLFLPKFLSNLRIKANLAFAFYTSKYIGTIEIFDSKIFGYVEFILFDKETKKKYAYRKILSFHKRIVPKSTEKATCFCHSKRRHVRISWNMAEEKINATFNIKGDRLRPTFCANLLIDTNKKSFAQASNVLPAFVTRRCSASVQMCGECSGFISVNKIHYNLQNNPNSQSQIMPPLTNCSAFLDLRRSYYPLRTHITSLMASGFVKNTQMGFRFSQSNFDPVDNYKYNDNMLFVENKATPLPPVKITMPYGIEKTWIIQDTESMVDLAFEPITITRRKLSLIFLHLDYQSVFGIINGTFLTSTGEEIKLKNFYTVGKKVRLRY